MVQQIFRISDYNNCARAPGSSAASLESLTDLLLQVRVIVQFCDYRNCSGIYQIATIRESVIVIVQSIKVDRACVMSLVIT